VSISAGVGACREALVVCFRPEDEEAAYPGGSGMPADFGFDIGGVLRSTTH